MLFTITIPTYNRADTLAEVLRSLGQMRYPSDAEHEILVVDNNSSDHTASVVEEFRPVLGPAFRSVFEPRQGVSHARNRALEEARGEVVCFIDDDSVADRNWLVAHMRAYQSEQRVVAVGGRIWLRWPEGWSRPTWLPPQLEHYLSALDLGPERQWMRYPHHPYGCNMSVKRQVARDIGGFSVRLGRTGTDLISNEEQHFFRQVEKHGGLTLYEPEALVYHMVPVSRLSKRFFLQRAYAQGISDALLKREIRGDALSRPSEARQLLGCLKVLTGAAFRVVGACVARADSKARFLTRARMAHAAGRVVGTARPLGRQGWKGSA